MIYILFIAVVIADIVIRSYYERRLRTQSVKELGGFYNNRGKWIKTNKISEIFKHEERKSIWDI